MLHSVLQQTIGHEKRPAQNQTGGEKSGLTIVKIRESAKFDIEVILIKCHSDQENTFEILC